MAAKRVSKSAVDWIKFQSLVPKHYQASYRQLKVKSDGFIGRVNARPAELSPINFAQYKAAGVNAAMVDNFEKAYKAIEVPYPTDFEDVKGQIDALEKEEMQYSKKTVEQFKALQSVAGEYLAASEKVPTLDQMTFEMLYDYFPEQRIDFENPSDDFNTGLSPHDVNDPELLKTFEQEIEHLPKRWEDAKDYHNLKGEWEDAYKIANPDEFPEWHAEREKQLAAEAKKLADARAGQK